LPLAKLKFIIGFFLIVFGFKWLKKSVLRVAGILPLRNEVVIYDNYIKNFSIKKKDGKTFDLLAYIVSAKAVFIEGIEVVLIVVALSTTGSSMIAVSLGAFSSLLLVIVLGIVYHKPLARVPENSLKFGVGALLTSFGIFWIGEGVNYRWPLGNWTILIFVLSISTLAVLCIYHLKKIRS